jgi:hypothetical protein
METVASVKISDGTSNVGGKADPQWPVEWLPLLQKGESIDISACHRLLEG